MNVPMGLKECTMLIKSIKHGLYVMKEIDDLDNPGQTRLQEEEDLDASELAQYEADIRAKNIILFRLSDENYYAIDSNQIAHDLWKALRG